MATWPGLGRSLGFSVSRARARACPADLGLDKVCKHNFITGFEVSSYQVFRSHNYYRASHACISHPLCGFWSSAWMGTAVGEVIAGVWAVT